MGGKFKVPSHQFVHAEGTTNTCTAKWPEPILVNFQKNCSLSEKLCLYQKSSCSFLGWTVTGWAITNCTKQNKSECWILHLGQGSPGYMYRPGDEGMESSPIESSLQVLVSDKLDMSQWCALAVMPWGATGGSTDTGQVPLYCCAVWSLTSNTLCHFRHHNLRTWNHVSKLGLWRWWVV